MCKDSGFMSARLHAATIIIKLTTKDKSDRGEMLKIN